MPTSLWSSVLLELSALCSEDVKGAHSLSVPSFSSERWCRGGPTPTQALPVLSTMALLSASTWNQRGPSFPDTHQGT